MLNPWTLTNSDDNTSRHKRLNGYQIVGHDGERMIVNAKDERCPSRAVDQPKEMLLAWRKLRVEVASCACRRIMSASIDDNAICSGEICL